MKDPKETSLYILNQLMGQIKQVRNEPDDDDVIIPDDPEIMDGEWEDTDID